jgi:hypothetical protein
LRRDIPDFSRRKVLKKILKIPFSSPHGTEEDAALLLLLHKGTFATPICRPDQALVFVTTVQGRATPDDL